MQMQTFTQTPQMPDGKCILLHFLLSGFLRFGTYLVTASVWWFYNWYYALWALLLAFILIGIARSKLLHSSVPKVQQEFSYCDKDIAAWYLHLHLC